MSLLLDALQCKNRQRPPIWLMRQAGRYLPAYQQVRKNRKLYEMFHDVETIVKVTTLPLHSFAFDAAILFSDILTVFDGLHIAYDFQEGVGPVILDSPHAFNVRAPDEAYAAVIQAISILKRELSVPLLGFVGAPFTVLSYYIEGGSSPDHKKTKRLLFSDPKTFERLLHLITEATIHYMKAQIAAGVDAIQIFDSWADVLPIALFKKYCLAPMRRLIEEAGATPTILFCRGSCLFAEALATIQPSCISLDWSGDLAHVRKQIPRSIAVQGNLDPMLLYAPKEHLRHEVDHLLKSMHQESGYIFNLGHGLLPDTPLDSVALLVERVHAHNR